MNAEEIEEQIGRLDPQIAGQLSTVCERFTDALEGDPETRRAAAVAVYEWRKAFGDLARKSGLCEHQTDDPSLVALTLIALHLWIA